MMRRGEVVKELESVGIASFGLKGSYRERVRVLVDRRSLFVSPVWLPHSSAPKILCGALLSARLLWPGLGAPSP